VNHALAVVLPMRFKLCWMKPTWLATEEIIITYLRNFRETRNFPPVCRFVRLDIDQESVTWKRVVDM